MRRGCVEKKKWKIKQREIWRADDGRIVCNRIYFILFMLYSVHSVHILPSSSSLIPSSI